MTSFAFDPANDDLVIASRREIVFIEDDVADIDTLVKGIGSGKEILILDSTQDGLHQIAQALAGRSGIDGLHIVSHGQTGAVGLGSLMLDAGKLDAHQGDLQAIGRSLRAGGDILLYGCDIGAGGGAGFVQQLAIATGADVAASSNRTGNAALGGDWELEVSTGQVETTSVASPQLAALYQRVLSLADKTVGFETPDNFVSRPANVFAGSDGDIIYRVDGNDNYRLVIDAASTAVVAYSYASSYLNIAGQGDAAQERTVTLSFEGGQQFTLSSLQATNFQALPSSDNHDPTLAQVLTFTGYDDKNNVISTQTAYVPQQPGYTTFHLSGFTNVTRFIITTADNGGVLKFVALDNLVFDKIQQLPRIDDVTSSPLATTYKPGDTIDIQVMFNTKVDVTGTPQLTLKTDTGDRVINYASGSGESVLHFHYTVQPGDLSLSLNYKSTAIALNGGTIKAQDDATLAAILTLPDPNGSHSLAANTNIIVDGVAPTLAITSDLTALTADGTAKITFTFSEDPGASFDSTAITVTGGTLSGLDTTGSKRTAIFTPTADLDNGTASISVDVDEYSDLAGNRNTAASNVLAISYDTKAPTVTVSRDPSVLKVGESRVITFTFSEDPGSSFDAADLTVSGGTLEAISGSGLTRTATFKPTANIDNGTATVTVNSGAYHDAAGNGSPAASTSLSYDTTAPTLTIGSDKPALKAGETATITFTFSEDPGTSWDGSAGSIAVSGGTLSAITGTGKVRTATFTPAADADGDTAVISVMGTSYADAAGNTGANASLSFSYDTRGPATTVASIALSSAVNVNGDTITNAPNQTISGTLSASLAAGEHVQVSVDGGASWNNATSAARQDTWSIAATLLEGGHDVQVRVLDAVDNAGAVRTQGYTLDTVKPSVSITSSAAQLKGDETATITFTFSEDPGTSFGSGSVTVSGGTLSPITGTGMVRTATFKPAADVDGDTAVISVMGTSYADAAGNTGANASLSFSYDTQGPATTVASIALSSDTNVVGDFKTNVASQTISGTLSASLAAGEHVQVSVDGGASWNNATSAAGQDTWSIAATLLEGGHDVQVRVLDAVGNAGAVRSQDYTLDTTKPTVAITSSAAQLKGGEKATITFIFSEDPGTSFSWDGTAGSVTVSGGTLSPLQGSGTTRTAVFTPAANVENGTASISIGAGKYHDLAGNDGLAGATPLLTFDTQAPAAPAAPLLNASSDTDTLGDGITENDRPVIEGMALANTLVTLYDDRGKGPVKIGTATADASGKWSIATAGLSVGAHKLTVTQSDTAGNESVASAVFALRIDAPPAPTTPTTLIDGVQVAIQPVSLPGGVIGSAVSIPVVGAGRVDSSGHAGVADIPLLTSNQGGNLLLAQVPAGYGLSASGASVPTASGAELLLAAIKAATPSHGAIDQGHLTSNGQSFLSGLASGGTLLVETVKPVSSANAADAVLTLSGPAQPQGQSTALVIDASGLATSSVIALQQVNFAAVIGAANVVSAGGMILTGDAASQHFTVTAAAGPNAVLAGGGNDTLALSTPVAGAGAVMLHGGSANDVAVFSGARADYDLAFHNGYVTVTSKSGPPTTAMVVNVETLQFSDGSVAVQNSTDMSTLAGIYQTVLGRQADISGIEFWANGHQAGASWGAIALDIISSTEHTSGHGGFNGVAAHDLTLLYTALFNRAPDAEGLAYWTNAMAHGASLEQVATDFVKSVEMTGHQRAALDWDFIVG